MTGRTRCGGEGTALGLAVDLVLRTQIPSLALVALWGALLWGPWVSVAAFFVVFHSVRYAERRFGPARPLPPQRLQRQTRVLAHPEDIHVVAFMLLYWAGLASAAAIYLSPAFALPGAVTRVGFCLAAGVWLGWAGAVNTGINFHSHAHRGIFKQPRLNRWVGRLWTIPGGIPAYFWSYKHLVVHHRELHEETDWVQPRRDGNGRYEGLYRYSIAYWPWRWAWHFYLEFSRASPAVRRRAQRELGFFLLCWSAPFYVDMGLGVGVWLLHQIVGNNLIMGPGMYAQHAGCSNEVRFGHSNTFLSAAFNKMMFNAGFHIEHTERPGVHWSELPALHEAMKADLSAHGARVLPYGIFTGAGLLSSLTNPEGDYAEFVGRAPRRRV